MATLRDIRNRIKAVKSTAKITSAMKMVAASKLRRAQNAIESARPYVSKLDYMLSNLVSAIDDNYSHQLLQNRTEVKNIAIIVVTSDRGLCGSFNTNIFKEVANYIQTDVNVNYPNAKVSVVSVGRKAVTYFKKNKADIIAEFPNIFTGLKFDTAKDIVNSVVESYIAGTYDKVVIVNNNFINILRQKVTINQLLPIAGVEHKDADEKNMNVDYIFEPDQKSILDELLPKLIDIKMWRALLESNAAEFAARMMAMDNATRNANDLIKALDLQYNKARQASITKEMLEIVGGAEALRSA